jgi:hypothetical protein
MFNEVPNETATAAGARIAEKKSLQGPIMGRVQAEFLSLLIMRVFNIMDRAGDLPPVPEELLNSMAEGGPQGKRLRIEYFNETAREQRSLGVYAFQRSMGALAPIVGESDPFGVMDNFDTDATARDIPMLLGVPAKYLATEEKRDAARAKRAQAMNAQKQGQDIAGAADIAAKLAGADMGGNNALTVLAQQAGPGMGV